VIFRMPRVGQHRRFLLPRWSLLELSLLEPLLEPSRPTKSVIE